MKKFDCALLLSLTLLTIWLLQLLINHFVYRDLPVTHYHQLIEKVNYAQITKQDLRFGSFDLVESTLCQKTSETLTQECLVHYQKKKTPCDKKVFANVDVIGFTEKMVKNLASQFDECRKTSLWVNP